MNRKIAIVFLLLFRMTASFGQTADTVKLFFGINEHQLSADNQMKLDVLYKVLGYYPRINIIGYADFLGDDPRNLSLSVSRAEAAKAYLLCLNKSLVITTEGKGTVPALKKDLKNGDPVSRRIDVIIKNRPGVKIPPAPPFIAHNTAPEIIPDGIKQFADKISALDTLRAGSSISLDELNFQPGRHFLNMESLYYIKTLLAYLKSHSKLVFEIKGHICCDYTHPDAYDIDSRKYGLSLSRAKFIYDFLARSGIDPKRMRYSGVGSSQPKIYPELTDHDQTVNRRVEIVVIEK
jgi:outer membrane protein OmpA-like peptidoglycan-associated protein